MTCWYTRREIALRVSILFTGLTLAQAVSGLLAAAIFSTLTGSHGLAGWQWLFIVLASTGAGLAVICMFMLPDYPHSKTGSAQWSLTEDMRRLAAARIAADRVSVTTEAKTGVWQGLRLCLVDYKTWILVFANIFISAAYGFSNFFPAIVRGFGYESRTTILLLTAPPYIFASIWGLANSWHSDKTDERGYHYAVPMLVGIGGYVICLATTAAPAQYAASFMYIGGMFTAYPLLLSWIAITLSKTPEKKAASIAVVSVLGQIGNTVSPYFFISSDEPRYRLAFLLMMGSAALSVGLALLLKFCLRRSNMKKLANARENGTAYSPYSH